jgi:hypothetical protein
VLSFKPQKAATLTLANGDGLSIIGVHNAIRAQARWNFFEG